MTTTTQQPDAGTPESDLFSYPLMDMADRMMLTQMRKFERERDEARARCKTLSHCWAEAERGRDALRDQWATAQSNYLISNAAWEKASKERDEARADAKSWSEQAEQLATDALAYAKERDELRNYLDASHYAQCNQELRAEVARLREASVHVYNSGYHRGHRDTVEGGYVDIHRSDMPHYHHEEANESLQEALAAVREKEEGK
jgi:chromosome segregation ATPase